MNEVQHTFQQVISHIGSEQEAFDLVKEEIRSAFNGCYEARHFARKSQIKVEDKTPQEVPYGENSPQMVLTRLAMELAGTRDAVLIRLQVIDLLMRKFGFGKYEDNASKQKIRSICEEKKIEHLVHFTRVENLQGICNLGLMSRDYMDNVGHMYVTNDPLRMDRQFNAVSLSVSFPNYKMFWKHRLRNEYQAWAVLVLSPAILWEEDCLFCRHNAADRRIRNISDSLGKPSDLAMMFDENDLRNQWLRPCDPTHPQAEVLVFNNIGTRHILGIMVKQEEDHDLAQPLVRDFPITVDNRFFQSRDFYLKALNLRKRS